MKSKKKTWSYWSHQLIKNDMAPLIGEEVNIRDKDRDKVRVTEVTERNVKTEREHRNRIKHIYNYF